MAFSGFLFISWRIFELIMLIPPVGMLSWFVHQYVKANLITPDYILVLFIVTVLALAWVFFTIIAYVRARHDALFVALVDLAFVGALIAGIYFLRHIATQNCSNSSAGVNDNGVYVHIDTNKQCAMLKASFAFAIINCLAFFVTFLLALLVHHHHRNDDQVVVKREYRTSHRSHSGRRSGSRDPRSGRSDYGYDQRQSSGRRSHRSSSQRRQYYV